MAGLGPLLALLRWLAGKWPVWLLAPLAILAELLLLLLLLLLLAAPGSASSGHPPADAWLRLGAMDGHASVSFWSMISGSLPRPAGDAATLVALLLDGR